MMHFKIQGELHWLGVKRKGYHYTLGASASFPASTEPAIDSVSVEESGCVSVVAKLIPWSVREVEDSRKLGPAPT